MSSSQSKTTSATCPKCEQSFKFERVPQMTSIVCPHCSVKIRLERKTKPRPSGKQPSESQKIVKPCEPEQTQKKSSPLPAAEIAVSEAKILESSESGLHAGDSANAIIDRKRQQQDFDALPDRDLNKSETAEFVSESIPVSSSETNSPEISSSEISSPEISSSDVNLPDDSLPIEDNISSDGQADPRSAAYKSTPARDDESADDLLPPKFLVADIDSDENTVILPTAGGGFQVVDKTEVRVMHEGRAVKLVSLSPDELKRVRLIENLVALVIAAIMLAVAAWLVL